MKVSEINNKDIWENFLLNCEEKTFLNSWNWGEFQKMMGNKIWRLGISNNDGELFSVVLLVKTMAKRGTFLFVPHGLNLKQQVTSNKRQVLEVLLEELKKVARKENTSFIRISPIWKRNEENNKIFKNLGFKEAPIHIHPEVTWELDITLPEENLLMNTRKTTRYLIRQAQKNPEIEIIQSRDLSDVGIFNKLYQEIVDRHHFIPFSLNYLKNEFLAFNSDNQIVVFLGKYKNEVISSAIIIFWQNMAFYHQGASSLKYSKIPVSYSLQWETIKEAKKRNCSIYNFWGIAPNENPNHPWRGLTLFKMGFGGYKKEYLKTKDFPISKKYWLTYIFEKIRFFHRFGF